ncbi:MAG TPA: PAS domain S-box protein [Gaiellaceae bacterium]
MRHESARLPAREDGCVDATTPDPLADSQSEALMRLRRLFDGIPTGIISNDHDSGVIEVNPALVRMLARPAEEITPDNLSAWTHPDDHGTRVLREEFDQDKRRSYDIEKRYIRGDGKTIWCRVVVEDVRGDGPGRSSIAMFEDITERKLAELALRDHTDRLAQIVEIQQAVAVADLDLQAVMALICERAQRLMDCDGVAVMMVEGDRLVFGADSGFSETNGGHEELRRNGLPMDSFTGWALLRNESVLANDLQNDPHAHRKTARRDAIGSMIVVPLRHGETPVGVLQVVGHDKNAFAQEDVRTIELLSVVLSAAISHASEFEAKRAQVATLERLRVIFEGSSIGITRVDTEARVLEANPAFEEMIGYTTAELRELPPGKITHPDDWGIHVVLHAELMAGKRDSYHYEKRYVRKDGKFVWCQLTAVLERDADGRPSVVTTMIEDISERKEAEEELRQSQRLETIGRLAGGVAHDFNNLLTAIAGYSDFALARIERGEANDPKLRTDVEQIRKAADRATSLTQQLLAFSRRQVLQPRTVELNALVSNVRLLLERLIGADVELVTSLADGEVFVRADPGRLEQVLVNLAVNTRDAMPEGGTLTLTVSETEVGADHQIVGWGAEPGRYPTIVVRDTGHGMDAETLGQAFEPFFTTKDVGVGTGLGLSMVYGIVKQSGGWIMLESEPDVGTTATIFVPPSGAPQPSLVEHVLEPAAGQGRILLVEDEAVVRVLVAEMLAQRGYEVLAAPGPLEALALAEAVDCDLLVTDVVMPTMNGRELARRLRDDAPGLHVVYMSGHAPEAVLDGGRLDPAEFFLQKPFTAAELGGIVREALDAAAAVLLTS